MCSRHAGVYSLLCIIVGVRLQHDEIYETESGVRDEERVCVFLSAGHNCCFHVLYIVKIIFERADDL